MMGGILDVFWPDFDNNDDDQEYDNGGDYDQLLAVLCVWMAMMMTMMTMMVTMMIM